MHRTYRTLARWERSTPNHGLPDFIERWSRAKFYRYGTIGGGLVPFVIYFEPVLGTFMAGLMGGYWLVGLRDMNQQHQAVRRNFPVLGNLRYILESVRPEVRQYFMEADNDGVPFTREQRSIVYQRAKNMSDTVPFGTRKDLYNERYEWINHSMWPTTVPKENQRIPIGGDSCAKPYSAALMNISAMSYGSLSENAVTALNKAAKKGRFYHNTGEGGLSPAHRQGGDVVWQLGTGNFGARNPNGSFSGDKFKAALQATPTVMMIEIKLSQGAKPAHGGILPASKLTPEIAEIRGVPLGKDVLSPPTNPAFKGARGLVLFIQHIRELSGGLPVGFKMCLGQPEEFMAVVQEMLDLDIYPDFITVDGAEGGTGAAPAEFSNHVGTPLIEGLHITHNVLVGANIRHKLKIVSSGKVISGFHLVRQLALGADIVNAARSMMFALGCIQSLKCNTNKCPTGVATTDPTLAHGLVVEDKFERVYSYHAKTIAAAMELVGAAGLSHPDDLQPQHVIRRLDESKILDYGEIYPHMNPGDLLTGAMTIPYSEIVGYSSAWFLEKWAAAEQVRTVQNAKGFDCLTLDAVPEAHP